MVKKVSIISYLNTLPFLYGLKRGEVRDEIEFDYSPPAVALEKLVAGESDIGIVPAAGLLHYPTLEVVSNYSISADGEVASVLLCSDKPLQKIEKIYLDDHSVTSALLLKMLLHNYWNSSPSFEKFSFERESIEPLNSYLLIGDKALQQAGRFKYVYDLALEWKKFTSLPFVFACWCSGGGLESDFLDRFNSSLKLGVNNILEAVKREQHSFDNQYARHYLTKNILYPLTERGREGLALYLKLAKELLLLY